MIKLAIRVIILAGLMITAGLQMNKPSGEVMGKSTGEIRGVIMPHHELAKEILEQTAARLSEEKNIQIIAVISPNHYRPGGAEVTTTAALQDFPIAADLTAEVDDLTPEFIADSILLKNEHGLIVPMGYLRRAFPNAKFVPMAVTPHLSGVNSDRLAKWLADKIGKQGLIVTSVDFSHGNMVDKAMSFNRETITTIEALDYRTLLSYGDEHVDSTKAVEVLMKAMEIEGANDWEVWYNSHGALLTNLPSLNGTSYVAGVFRDRGN